MPAGASDINWRWSVHGVVYHRLSRCKSVYGTESHAPLNTPKRREHSLIYAAVNLTPEYRPNRRCAWLFVLLKLTIDRHETSRPLCNSRELLVWSKLTTCSRHLRHCYIGLISWSAVATIVLLAVGLHIHTGTGTKFLFLPRLISEISESKNSQSGGCLYPRRSQAEK